MSVIDILLKMPCLYIATMIVFTLYYTIRGVLYFKVFGTTGLSRTEKVIIEYIHNRISWNRFYYRREFQGRD